VRKVAFAVFFTCIWVRVAPQCFSSFPWFFPDPSPIANHTLPFFQFLMEQCAKWPKLQGSTAVFDPPSFLPLQSMAKEVRVKMRSVSASDFPPGGAARGERSQRQRVTAGEVVVEEGQEMLDDGANGSITLVDLQSNSLSALPPQVLLLGESHALPTSFFCFNPRSSS